MEALQSWQTLCQCRALAPGAAANLSSAKLDRRAWRNLAEAGRCWDVGRKIPPYLYAAANTIFQGLTEEEAFGRDPQVSTELCIPGAFSALLVVMLLWEAHDAPEALVDSALTLILGLELEHVAPAMGQLGAGGVIDCGAFAGGEMALAAEGPWWPGVLDLRWLRRLKTRLTRKRRAWQSLLETGEEPWHIREEAEHDLWNSAHEGPPSEPASLCLCLMHGEGAATLVATLDSWREGGLLDLARRRFVAFLDPAADEPSDDVTCWRTKVAERYGFEQLQPNSRNWPDPFIRKRQRHGSPGAAMAACAQACDQEFLIFLEDDFELVTRPPELVRHRLRAAMQVLRSSSTQRAAPDGENTGEDGDGHCTLPTGCPKSLVLGVHLRHKLFFGPPFYEMLTAAQHGEPPSPYAAWYYSADPVESKYPDNLWSPPFWDSGSECDSDRMSWHGTLRYQHIPALESEQRRHAWPRSELPGDEAAARVWWCSENSSLLCTSTAAHRDPFRSLMYSTNPMLYRTDTWRLHLASYAAVLQDLRAVEESVSSSYMWRVEPSFVLALSLGLFRHHRLDRSKMPGADDDADAALCMQPAGETQH